LDRHILAHTGEKPFKCPSTSCDKSFSRKEHLARHFDTIHGAKRKNVCDECKRAFKDAWYLRKHRALKHGGRRPPALPSTMIQPGPNPPVPKEEDVGGEVVADVLDPHDAEYVQ